MDESQSESQALESETQAGTPAPPADPPRELTPLVRRRTWTEPRVRVLWVLALGVLVATLYVVATQLAAWFSERALLTNGVAVKAVIVRAQDAMNDITVPNKKMPSDSVCEMHFPWKGEIKKVVGQLPEHMERDQKVLTGDKDKVMTGDTETVTLRVDPADPDHWTDRTEPPPMKRQLIGVSIGLPAVAILVLLAALKRRKLVRVWQEGVAVPAIVVGKGQTPVAPRSRVLRCTRADSNDKGVFTVYLPAGASPVEAGDLVWVLYLADKPAPLYAAAWFEREQRAGQA